MLLLPKLKDNRRENLTEDEMDNSKNNTHQHCRKKGTGGSTLETDFNLNSMLRHFIEQWHSSTMGDNN